MTMVKKPGYMQRACVAWVVLNLSMFIVLGFTVWLLSAYMNAWYVILPLVVSLVITEWIITGETIAPIVREWIKQEEYVKEGDRPSWEKNTP